MSPRSTLLAGTTRLTVRYSHKHLRRAIEDIGVLDENESEVYTTGNPGYHSTSDSVVTSTGASLVPKAQRDYDGLEVRIDGRKRNFSYNASYTFSRLFGNWAGLANSDEDGRSDPNVSRAFDLSPGNFDEQGHNPRGLLATDRPHTLKLFGNYTLDWALGDTSFGVSQVAYSGTPLSSEVTFIVPIFYDGRGDLGRTEAFTQTDLLLKHGFRIGGARRMILEAYVFNLLDQEAVTNVTTRYNRNGSIPELLRAVAVRRDDWRRDATGQRSRWCVAVLQPHLQHAAEVPVRSHDHGGRSNPVLIRRNSSDYSPRRLVTGGAFFFAVSWRAETSTGTNRQDAASSVY